jgi:DNA-binding transcriptional ArsR family regulator
MNALTALAEPNRLLIVELLRDGPRPVGEIAEKLHLNQPQVSKHLRVLTDAGVVDVRPSAQQRIYSLRPQAFREIDQWLESYRRLWDERQDRLNEYLRNTQAKEKNDGRKD